MKNLSVFVLVAYLINLTCSSAQAGLLTGAAKGIGKGTKAVAGCVDRGAKGVGKGAKTVVELPAKGAKTIVGGGGNKAPNSAQ